MKQGGVWRVQRETGARSFFLDGADVVARFQQMGGKRVAQGVTPNRFVNLGGGGCFFERFRYRLIQLTQVASVLRA